MRIEKPTGRRGHIAAAARLALLTGMRRGEILSLRWGHVNLSGKVQNFVVEGETWEVRPGRPLIEGSKNGRFPTFTANRILTGAASAVHYVRRVVSWRVWRYEAASLTAVLRFVKYIRLNATAGSSYQNNIHLLAPR